MSTSDGRIVTYQIQYLDEFNLWEDIPHKIIYDVDTLEDVILRTKDRYPDIRVLKVTKEVVFDLKRVE